MMINVKLDEMKNWKYEKVPEPFNTVEGRNFKVYEDTENKFPICSLPCSTAETQSVELINKQKRNARIIAAAPEILDALILMYEQFKDSIGNNDNAYDAIAVKKAQKAINKALGINE
jgi:hypothetical protein